MTYIIKVFNMIGLGINLWMKLWKQGYVRRRFNIILTPIDNFGPMGPQSESGQQNILYDLSF